jgi:hypothetical protein
MRQNKSGQYKENTGRAAPQLEYVSPKHCLCCRVVDQRVVNDQIAGQQKPQNVQTRKHAFHCYFSPLTKSYKSLHFIDFRDTYFRNEGLDVHERFIDHKQAVCAASHPPKLKTGLHRPAEAGHDWLSLERRSHTSPAAVSIARRVDFGGGRTTPLPLCEPETRRNEYSVLLLTNLWSRSMLESPRPLLLHLLDVATVLPFAMQLVPRCDTEQSAPHVSAHTGLLHGGPDCPGVRRVGLVRLHERSNELSV